MAKKLNKKELIELLVSEYGYVEEDLKKDEDGKPYTNAKLESFLEQEIEDAKQAEVDKTRVVAKRSSLKEDTKIQVMNGLMGTLIYKSKRTGFVWKFSNFGQMDTIPYGELITMKNMYPAYFNDAWLIVLDKEVQEELKLTELYQNILTPENIDSIFEKSAEDIEVIIDSLTSGMKRTFILKAMEKYEDGTLDSNKVVKMIEEKFKFSLESNAPTKKLALDGQLKKGEMIQVD